MTPDTRCARQFRHRSWDREPACGGISSPCSVPRKAEPKEPARYRSAGCLRELFEPVPSPWRLCAPGPRCPELLAATLGLNPLHVEARAPTDGHAVAINNAGCGLNPLHVEARAPTLPSARSVSSTTCRHVLYACPNSVWQDLRFQPMSTVQNRPICPVFNSFRPSARMSLKFVEVHNPHKQKPLTN